MEPPALESPPPAPSPGGLAPSWLEHPPAPASVGSSTPAMPARRNRERGLLSCAWWVTKGCGVVIMGQNSLVCGPASDQDISQRRHVCLFGKTRRFDSTHVQEALEQTRIGEGRKIQIVRLEQLAPRAPGDDEGQVAMAPARAFGDITGPQGESAFEQWSARRRQLGPMIEECFQRTHANAVNFRVHLDRALDSGPTGAVALDAVADPMKRERLDAVDDVAAPVSSSVTPLQSGRARYVASKGNAHQLHVEAHYVLNEALVADRFDFLETQLVSAAAERFHRHLDVANRGQVLVKAPTVAGAQPRI